MATKIANSHSASMTKPNPTKPDSTKQSPKTARRVLGRGLSALIPESDMDFLNSVARGSIAAAPLLPASSHTKTDGAREIQPVSTNFSLPTISVTNSMTPSIEYVAVASITPNPYQPRQHFAPDEMESLAASVTEHGVLQPIIVRPLDPHSEVAHSDPSLRFELVAGERRWRAAQRAELPVIPAVVRALNDQQSLELAVVENVQRHDISAIESAAAFKRLNTEFGLSQEQVARRVGKSRVAVANTIRLLDLPAEAIDALREGKITEGHGRALLMAEGDGGRRALLRRTIRDGLTVRDVERMARQDIMPEDDNSVRISRTVEHQGDLARIEKSLQRELGARVKLKPKRRGGQILIDFYSPEDLHRLIRVLKAGIAAQTPEPSVVTIGEMENNGESLSIHKPPTKQPGLPKK